MRTGLFLVLLGLLAAPALAQHGGWRGRDGVQPLDRLLPEIRRSHPGTFYDAEGPTRGPDGQWHYHLKWMTPGGRVIWLDTNARTGRVLGILRGHRSADFYRGNALVPRGNWERRDDNRFDGTRDNRGWDRGGHDSYHGGGYHGQHGGGHNGYHGGGGHGGHHRNR